MPAKKRSLRIPQKSILLTVLLITTTQAIFPHPTDSNILESRARRLFVSGDIRGAQAIAEEILKTRPKSTQALYILIHSHLIFGNTATTHFAQFKETGAHTQDPKILAQALSFAGDFSERAGAWTKALHYYRAAFEKAPKTDPTRWQAHIYSKIARIKQKQKAYREAKHYYQKAITLQKPRFPEDEAITLIKLAILHEEEGALEKSIKLLQKSEILLKTSISRHYKGKLYATLGRILLSNKNFIHAEYALKKAIEHSQHNTNTAELKSRYIHLSLTHAQQNDYSLAHKALEKALKLSPKSTTHTEQEYHKILKKLSE